MEVVMTAHELMLTAFGLVCLLCGICMHMAWDRFLDWREDRAEARTPEGQARLARQAEHDAAWEASQAGAMDTLAKLAAGERVPAATGPLRRAGSRTQALGSIQGDGYDAEPDGGPLRGAEGRERAARVTSADIGNAIIFGEEADPLHQALDAQRRELEPLPQAHRAYAGSDDRFTDGTGPQDAVAAEISGVGAMVAVPKDRRENLGPDTAEIAAVTGPGEFAEAMEYQQGQLDAIEAERSKWGFVPVRMGTPPHGYPVIGGNGGPSYFGPAMARGGHRPAALEALDADSLRLARLLAKADAVVSPKADWDDLARQIHHEQRELVHA
jgi:hypothetical protein